MSYYKLFNRIFLPPFFFQRRFFLHLETFADCELIFILGSYIQNSVASFRWGSWELF
jgi:hypothetical protein